MNSRVIIVLFLVGFVIVFSWFAFNQDRGVSRDLSGNVIEDELGFFEDTLLDNNFEFEGEGMKNEPEIDSPQNLETVDKVLITDGTKHIIPLSEIRSGGPPQDGIPSIDDPQFVSIGEADKIIDDEGLGIAVSFNGINRFYPNQILVWHEIVNDIIGGTAALITYCPLCGTGIVFDPMVNGVRTEFGTSGKLWNSNLIMYDRQTQSYWSQVLGKSIVGEQAGTALRLLPYQNLTYANWKKEYGDGEVLSSDTGFFRDYQDDPYGDYYTDRSLIFSVNHSDDRYHPKALTYGIEVDGRFRAYPQEELEKGPENFSDLFAGKSFVIRYKKDTQKFTIKNSESDEEVVPVFGFWFSWISVHPKTEVFTQDDLTLE